MKTPGVLIVVLVLLQCTNKEKTIPAIYTEEELITYREEGLQVAMATKVALGSVLVPTVTQQGTKTALEFCSVKAIPLTDSMAVVTGTEVYRVSDLPRNPDNLATGKQLEYIQKAKLDIANGEAVTPQVFGLDEKVIGFYPILTNQFCLQCHGSPGKEITEETYDDIQKLYPNDKATGYGEGELRGIFVVEIDSKKN
ncbi:MAG: DUF3365 domain-containing protein [Balneolales bacterium]|nr:DUF3365 domain-containing protein [Balneolales bacterium]